MEGTVFYVILEVKYHHFCHMLLVTQINIGPVWKETGYTECEYQEAAIIGGPLGSWLPEWLSSFSGICIPLDKLKDLTISILNVSIYVMVEMSPFPTTIYDETIFNASRRYTYFLKVFWV